MFRHRFLDVCKSSLIALAVTAVALTAGVPAAQALTAQHDVPPENAAPFTARACEGSNPSDHDLQVAGAQLDNYNAGGIAVLYPSVGHREPIPGSPPGCGVRYVESAGGPVSEWMYCTDMLKDSCLNVQGDGELQNTHGNTVTPMEWLDGHPQLDDTQQRVIAYLLQHPVTVTPLPLNGLTQTIASNENKDTRETRQYLVWCVSNYVGMTSGDADFKNWCDTNIGPAKVKEILALTPSIPEPVLRLSGSYLNLPVGTTARFQVVTNFLNRPISFSASGGNVTVCAGDANLTATTLTINSVEPDTPATIELCIFGAEAGEASLRLSATPTTTAHMSWSQANHSVNANSCQVYAAFETSRANEQRVLAQVNFVEDVGTFNLRKTMHGITAASFPAGTTFPVTATWADGSETFHLPADGTVVESGVSLPEGTVVSFTEGNLPDTPAGFILEKQEISESEITILADQNPNIAINVTNTYSPVIPAQITGGFDLSKSISGVDDRSLLKDVSFTVVATWSIAGKDFQREFVLRGDGATVTGARDLPVGTVVTFQEKRPASIPGYIFRGGIFNASQIKIDENKNILVRLENFYSKTPLPNTGSNDSTGIMLGALVLLVTGAVVLTWRQRLAHKQL